MAVQRTNVGHLTRGVFRRIQPLRVLRPIVAALPFAVAAQQPGADLTGMWSDPPATPEDAFCFFSCTELGVEYLATLLDDRANDDRPYRELSAEASKHQLDEYILPRLTAAARTSTFSRGRRPRLSSSVPSTSTARSLITETRPASTL